MTHRIVVRATILACGLIMSGQQTARSQLDPVLKQCQTTIAKESRRFLKGMLALQQQCHEANRRSGCSCTGGGNAGESCTRLTDCPDATAGTACSGVACTAPDPAAVANLVAKLRNGLDGKCSAGNLEALGYPGACDDPDADGFSVEDLKKCIEQSHRHAVDGICVGRTNNAEPCATLMACPDTGPGTECLGVFGVENDERVCGELSPAHSSCQREIARSGSRLLLEVLRRVQRCRDRILQGKLTGILPNDCATDDPKTRDAIARAKRRSEKQIARKCDDTMVADLYACAPDQTTVAGPACPLGIAGCDTCTAAAACESCRHQTFADDPVANDVPALIDFEYPTPRTCGDQRVNLPGEECDGASDAACPGQCGDPNGCFACRCLVPAQLRVIEHMNSDLDLGYTGLSHDGSTPEGGGFFADLWDCDGPAGPDTVCTVGPSCSGGAHAPCSPAPDQTITGDSICQALGQGSCRKTLHAPTGPHCEIDVQRRCDAASDCPPGEDCIKTFHGPPLPLSAGSISVCSVNVFSEDVVGTTDLATGAVDLRLRQRSLVYGPGNLAQPCPVCGGFCAGEQTAEARVRCDGDADCHNPPHHCVTDHVCSYGPNVDEPCRAEAPYGGPTQHFGLTSVDCPPPVGLNISGPGLDILLDPFTTETATLKAGVPCLGPDGRACFGGTNDRRPCTSDSECPLGECNDQCFCPSTQLATAPNSCLSACVGGGNDAQPCDFDADCPGGFCHRADCRLDAGDTDSCQEGVCPAGPIVGRCSVSVYKGCLTDAECHPPTCATCGAGETCQIANRACFLNGEIDRCGAPGSPEAVATAVFCIPKTGAAAINSVTGLPGPGALTQPLTTCVSGF